MNCKKSQYTESQLKEYRGRIRAAYREGKLVPAQIELLRTAGFNLDLTLKTRPIVNLTTGEIYGSMKAAAESIGIKDGSSLRAAIDHKRLFKGHAFWWADDPNPPNVSEFRKPIHARRPVIDLTTGKVYESITAAAIAANIPSRKKIHTAIMEKRLCNGHAFWWADDPNPPDISELRKAARKTKPVVDLTTGKVFETQNAAAASIKGSKEMLRIALREKRLYKGHAFWYADDPNPPTVNEFKEPARQPKPVIDLTTGEVYKTIAAAAIVANIPSGKTIRTAIKEKRLLNGHALWWADDPNPPALSEFKKPAAGPKPIIDLTTGEVYESLTCAAKSFRLASGTSFIQAVEAKRLYKGHAFWYADDPNPPTVNEFKEPARQPKPKPRPVIDLTTGEVYKTIAAAAKSVGASGGSVIAKAIRAKRLFKGHAFWWADDSHPPATSEFRKPRRSPVKPVSPRAGNT